MMHLYRFVYMKLKLFSFQSHAMNYTDLSKRFCREHLLSISRNYEIDAGQETANLVTFTAEIFKEKLNFLCNLNS